MFENPRRGRAAKNFTTNIPKILDLKSSSDQIFFRKLSLGAPDLCRIFFYLFTPPRFGALNRESESSGSEQIYRKLFPRGPHSSKNNFFEIKIYLSAKWASLPGVRSSCIHFSPTGKWMSDERTPKAGRQQQVVTLRVCASRWTEVCGGIGSQRMQQRKMAPLLKITIVLVICSIFVECR